MYEKNSEEKVRFIPQLHLCNELYQENVIVCNDNDKAYMKIVNTYNTPIWKVPKNLIYLEIGNGEWYSIFANLMEKRFEIFIPYQI